MSDIYEKGTFRAKAVQGSAALGYTTSTNKEQVAVLFTLLEGPNEGQHITWYGYFTEKSAERTLESLRHMGWTGDDLFDLSTIGDADAPEVALVIDHEQNEQSGEWYARATWVNKLATSAALKTRMTDEQARAFAARMKGAAIATRQKAGTPAASPRPSAQRAPAPRTQAPPHIDDDNIPF